MAGQFDSTTGHTDGNGITLDNSAGATSPASLIANNVVYGNGARCIIVNSNVAATYITNSLVVNNTCYDNSLDLTQLNVRGNFVVQQAKNTWFINNLSYAWTVSLDWPDPHPLHQPSYG